MQVLLVSGDNVETLKKFRDKKGAGLSYVADPEAELIARYGAKLPVLSMARRVTFVIAPDGRIAAVHSNDQALDARQALEAAGALVSTASSPASQPSRP